MMQLLMAHVTRKCAHSNAVNWGKKVLACEKNLAEVNFFFLSPFFLRWTHSFIQDKSEKKKIEEGSVSKDIG